MITESQLMIERVQTGVRMEKRLLKVLKALAEYHDLSLGDLLEGIVLHAFDGKTPFSSESLKRIHDLKKFYSLDLDSSASHRLTEIKRASRNKSALETKTSERNALNKKIPDKKILDKKVSEKKK
ncbi:MAG: hypothetical protein ABSG07_05405 [Terriglobales bacterium]|jgi:hypothetical protein